MYGSLPPLSFCATRASSLKNAHHHWGQRLGQRDLDLVHQHQQGIKLVLSFSSVFWFFRS